MKPNRRRLILLAASSLTGGAFALSAVFVALLLQQNL
jgi:hypothetical protein